HGHPVSSDLISRGASMIKQDDFDKFVRDYNENYLLLLKRASVCHYDCLITSWLILRDLYSLIMTIYDMGSVSYAVMPHPFSFRGNDILLETLGFGQEEIDNIYEFLNFVRRTQGREFEEVMDEGAKIMCARISR